MKELNLRMKEIFTTKHKKIYPPFPTKNLLIEVTNACNCNCIFCANSKMKRKRKFIDKNLLFRVLDEAFELGMREVGFYTTGESLLDDNLSSYIKKAKDIGYNYVYITTNAILLDESKIKDLIDAGIDSMKLSINGINKKDYKFIHGFDYYEQVMLNLKKLFNYRNEHNLTYKIFVSYIATRYTDYNINEIKMHFENLCDEVAIVNVRNQSGMMPEINRLLSCVNPDNKIQAERIVPCHYVFDTVNVSCEGYLTACCTDFENYLAYANLNITSLKDAWHNELITSLRKKHLENNLCYTLCNNCINCSTIVPQPLSIDYIEKPITYQIFLSDSTNERIQKELGL